MLPPDEADQIVLVITEAFACGAEGRIPRGYLLLTEWMRETRRKDNSWTDDALRIWEAALERYKERFPAEWYPERQS